MKQMQNRTPKCDMIVDLQFGSTGKGLIAGFLAERDGYEAVVTANMPNAGHTYIDSKGNKFVHKALPNGIVSPNLKYIMIGPGAVFDPERLMKELLEAEDMLKVDLANKLMIHPAATVLLPEHTDLERQTLSGISSTMQGSMAAMAHKMQRKPFLESPVAGASTDDHVKPFVCSHQEWAEALNDAKSILAEGSQGFSLGINTRFYPYTTSRDCTPARFLSDSGIPHGMLRRVIGTARTFPIRVGNTADGYSGPCYDDQCEKTWEELGQKPELTTVTQRVRRVFTFSMEQIQEACYYCCPDEIFLNFVNYLQDNGEAYNLIRQIEAETGVPVRYAGHGPEFGDVEDCGVMEAEE